MSLRGDVARPQGRRANGGRNLLALVVLLSVCGHAPVAVSAIDEPADGRTITNTLNPRTADPALGAATFGGPVARDPAGNPLWAVPLRVLTYTGARPLFSRSRRPPSSPAVAAPASAPVPVAVRPAEPDHPLLTLVGTIVGTHEGIGIFVDQSSNNIIRLTTEQDFQGWTLRAVHERDAVFEKSQSQAILVLPARSATDQPATAAANRAAATPSGVWMDGDGQMISPPRYGKDTQSNPPNRAATWRDGDGQLIVPPTVQNRPL